MQPRLPFGSRFRHARPLGRVAGALGRGLLLGTMGLAALGCAEDPAGPTGRAVPAGPISEATAATYAVKDLGTLGGERSAATAINNVGGIVGWSETATGQHHAFIWRNGVMTDLGTLGGGFSEASGINVYGRVVGWSSDPSGRNFNHAVAWKDGVVKDLGTNGRMGSVARAIDDNGRIVGSLGPPLDGEGGELEISTSFLFHQGTWTVFGTGQITSEARAVSAGGTIVGEDYDERDDFSTLDAWVRENGSVQRLPKLIDGSSAARGINRYGTIVGYSETSGRRIHAVLWRRQ
jgi:probable HAF family extracellular repeat protein